MNDRQEMIAKILEKELVPGLGCSEPMAYGLAGATARAHAKGEIESIRIEAATGLVKGVQYVKIPRSGGLRGGKLAASIGAYGGNPTAIMEVFQTVTPEDVTRAQALVAAGKVTLERVADPPTRLYLKVTVKASEGTGIAIIQVRQNNLVYIEEDGKVLMDKREEALAAQNAISDPDIDYTVLSVESIYDFCKNAPLEKMAIVERAIEMNKAISEEGMNTPYGLEVGRTLRDTRGNGIISDDLATYASMWGAAGVDARMGGCPLPAMTNTGSGNQGITAIMAAYAAGEYLGKSYEEIVRGTAISSLVTIFIKTHTGKNSSRMAAVCCAAVAAGGSACGVAFMRGDDAACLSRILQTQLGTVAGLFCDGAKADCATKVAMAIHSAFQIMLVAEAGRAADEFNGIVGCTVEDTIKNFYRIQREGMTNIMETLYNIEVDKNHIC